MERVPAKIDIEEIKKKIEIIPQIQNLHHVHVWQIDEGRILFEGHITLNQDLKLSEANDIKQQVEEILTREYQIFHSMIELEFKNCNKKECIFIKNSLLQRKMSLKCVCKCQSI
jgi:cobalt-zinc-cadmium efflux system protein